MNRKKEIQPWRYFAVTTSFFCLILPKMSLFSGGNGAVGILLATALLCVFHRIGLQLRIKGRRPAPGLWTKPAAVLRMLWYAAVFAVFTGLGALMIRDFFWSGMSVWMAWGLFLIMLLPALGKKHGVWQRVTAVSFGWLTLFLAGMPLFAVRQIQRANMYTLSDLQWQNILAAALLYLLLSWYLLLIPGTGSRGMWPDSKEGLYLLNGVTQAALCLLLGLVYGSQGAGYRRWPMLSLLQGVSVPGKFVERVDAVWAAACLFAMFLAAGLLLERIFACFAVLGISTGTVRMWRYKDLAAFAILAVTVIVYRYSGVEAQDRAYVSTFMADWEDGEYVFWFPLQQTGEDVLAIHAKSFADARNIMNQNIREQPDFGHIRATVLGEGLLKQPEMTQKLFVELAAWQDMDENSYVYRCGDPEGLITADTKDVPPGIYLADLYENRFGPTGSYPILRELLVSWENGNYGVDIPEIRLSENLLTVAFGG